MVSSFSPLGSLASPLWIGVTQLQIPKLSVRTNSVRTWPWSRQTSHCGVEAQAIGQNRRHAVKKHRPKHLVALKSSEHTSFNNKIQNWVSRQIQTGLGSSSAYKFNSCHWSHWSAVPPNRPCWVSRFKLCLKWPFPMLMYLCTNCLDCARSLSRCHLQSASNQIPRDLGTHSSSSLAAKRQ